MSVHVVDHPLLGGFEIGRSTPPGMTNDDNEYICAALIDCIEALR